MNQDEQKSKGESLIPYEIAEMGYNVIEALLVRGESHTAVVFSVLGKKFIARIEPLLH